LVVALKLLRMMNRTLFLSVRQGFKPLPQS
jgi:hypothetical protein